MLWCSGYVTSIVFKIQRLIFGGNDKLSLKFGKFIIFFLHFYFLMQEQFYGQHQMLVIILPCDSLICKCDFYCHCCQTNSYFVYMYLFIETVLLICALFQVSVVQLVTIRREEINFQFVTTKLFSSLKFLKFIAKRIQGKN